MSAHDEEGTPWSEVIRAVFHGGKGADYTRGFDDATRWLLDKRPDSTELMEEHRTPPEGLPDCEGCEGDDVAAENVDCPACCYEWGFTEGAEK